MPHLLSQLKMKPPVTACSCIARTPPGPVVSPETTRTPRFMMLFVALNCIQTTAEILKSSRPHQPIAIASKIHLGIKSHSGTSSAA